MLLIRTYLKPSQIHGIGLFAVEAVSKGAIIWQFHPKVDNLISFSTFETLPEHTRKTIEHYATKDIQRSVYVLSGDDDRFTNHSLEPNTGLFGDDVVALTHIQADDEITADYNFIGMSFVPSSYKIYAE